MARFRCVGQGVLAGEKHLLRDEARAVISLMQHLACEAAQVKPGNDGDDGKNEQRSRQREFSFQAETHLSAPPRIPSACCAAF